MPRPTRTNGYQATGTGPISADRMAASPRRGDVMYQQDDFNLGENTFSLRHQGFPSAHVEFIIIRYIRWSMRSPKSFAVFVMPKFSTGFFTSRTTPPRHYV